MKALQKSKSNIENPLGTDVLVYTPSSSQLVVLNEVAYCIFDLIDIGASCKDIAAAIANVHTAQPQDEIERQVTEAVSQLVDIGLLEERPLQDRPSPSISNSNPFTNIPIEPPTIEMFTEEELRRRFPDVFTGMVSFSDRHSSPGF